MPRKPKKQPAQPEAPKSYDEFADDGEVIDDDPNADEVELVVDSSKSRDWRDVERLKEERQLRRLIKDEFDFD